MAFFLEYWYLWVVFLSILALAGVQAYQLLHHPSDKQLEPVRQWLVYAVIQAERELGMQTGQVKLRAVYDQFLTKFPWLGPLVPFATFTTLVDEALSEMEKLLDENDGVLAYVVNSSGS